MAKPQLFSHLPRGNSPCHSLVVTRSRNTAVAYLHSIVNAYYLSYLTILNYGDCRTVRSIFDLTWLLPVLFQDTEFPGIVLHSADYRNTSEYLYKNMKMNVDVMKIIQIGLTFMDQAGNSPSPISTWQFNFKFNLG